MKPFSRIISGTMTWGAWGSKFSIKQMQVLIEEAVGLGIYTFDHADIYGDYSTEQEFGKAFKESTIPRENVHGNEPLPSGAILNSNHDLVGFILLSFRSKFAPTQNMKHHLTISN